MFYDKISRLFMSTNSPYQRSASQLFDSLKTSKEGLSSEDAQHRLKLYGSNKLDAVEKDPLIFKLLRQFKDLMVVILIVAGSFSMYLKEYRDASIMFIIVMVNALIGFFQEHKAEKMMDSLKTLIHGKAKVMRDGKEVEMDGEGLVPGDIVVLEEGDAVPADVRIIEENNFSTNDFALTGESNQTKKFIHLIPGNVPLSDRNNLVFMSTTVATGNAKGIVVATGMQTEIGRIAHLTQEEGGDPSPLQIELNNLAKKLSALTIGVATILFIIGLFLDFSVRESFLFALAMAASTVPEGLPSQVSVALSLAAARLAKENAIVKKLSAVETLGSTHIICTDKTGTLTQNEMTVQKILIGEMLFDVSGLGYRPEGRILRAETQTPLTEQELKKYSLFFENGVFASNAKINSPDAEHLSWYAIGDPTEAALITLAAKAGVDVTAIDKKSPELREFTFDAVRKRMSSIRDRDGKITAYIKGSPQSVLERCTKIWDGERVRAITELDKKKIVEHDDSHARQALRNLGYAYSELPKEYESMEMDQVETDIVWLGMVSMIDPPRPEVKDAIASALKAHIRVIIITGDYALTAAAIAEKIGLKQKSDEELVVVTGNDLQHLSDINLLQHLIYKNLIFARTSPEDKLRIVRLLKKAGEIVAVTGDGVNDAPALKKADIGVAMGKAGTEVAKDAAEIILLDDSFATLVTAIKEGRTIFQNLKKTILSSMTSNGAELAVVLLSLAGTGLFNLPLAILAVQILAIDLIGEMLPLTFLTWDPAQKEIMTDPPRNPHEHIITKSAIFDLAISGFVMGLIGYVNFILLFTREGVSPVNISGNAEIYMRATTITYITIVLSQWCNILSRRTSNNESVFSSYLWSNKRLLLSYGISLFFLLNIVYNPLISKLLRTAPITINDWGYAIAGALIYLLFREIKKGAITFRNEKISKKSPAIGAA